MTTTSLVLKEINNLKEIIDNCLEDVGEVTPNHPIIESFSRKYDFARGKMNKSCNTDFYIGQCLAYKEILSVFGVKV